MMLARPTDSRQHHSPRKRRPGFLTYFPGQRRDDRAVTVSRDVYAGQAKSSTLLPCESPVCTLRYPGKVSCSRRSTPLTKLCGGTRPTCTPSANSTCPQTASSTTKFPLDRGSGEGDLPIKSAPNTNSAELPACVSSARSSRGARFGELSKRACRNDRSATSLADPNQMSVGRSRR